MIRVRCSRLPAVARCAASVVPPRVVIRRDTEEAAYGTGLHAVLAARISGSVADMDAQSYREAAIARTNGLDAKRLADMAGKGWAAWCKVKHLFPDAETEVGMSYMDNPMARMPTPAGGIVEVSTAEPIELTGTTDVISHALPGGLIRILDLKSGWADVDHSQQLRGYAWLACCDKPEATAVDAYVLRTSAWEVERWVWSRDELAAWWCELAYRLRTQREEFVPGRRQCRFCPRYWECPAQATLASVARAMLGQTDFGELDEEGLFTLWERCKAIQSQTGDVLTWIKMRLAAGGKASRGDEELHLAPSNRREIIYPLAEPVLSPMLGDALKAILQIGVGDVQEAVRATAGAKQKAWAVEELWRRLDAAGAVRVKVQETLEVRRR